MARIGDAVPLTRAVEGGTDMLQWVWGQVSGGDRRRPCEEPDGAASVGDVPASSFQPPVRTRRLVRTWISATGLIIVVLAAISAPVGYSYNGYLHESQDLMHLAEQEAARVTSFVYTHGPQWKEQPLRLLSILQLPESSPNDVRIRAFSDQVELIRIQPGMSPRWPVLTRSAPIKAAGATVGEIIVDSSLRQLMIESALVSLLAFAFGIAVYFTVRVFPLKVLDRTLDELEAANLAYTILNSELERQNKLLQEREAELHTQNLRFDAALNNMSLGLVMFDSDARLVIFNQRYAEIYGLSPESLRSGLPLRELLEHRAATGTFRGNVRKYIAALLEVLEQGQPVNVSVDLPDGRTIAVMNHPTVDGGWVATHEDVTERLRITSELERQYALLQQREEELHTQNLRLDAALNNMAHGLLMLDSQGWIVICNESYRQMYDLPRELVRPGCPLRDVFAFRAGRRTFVGDPDAFVARLRDTIARGEKTSRMLELPDGRMIAALNYPMPGGGWIATHEDVTERLRITSELERQYKLLQQREEELRTQNLRFDAALNHMSQGLCMFDADQNLVVCNERYARMYGLDAELVKPGTAFSDIIRHRIAKGVYAGNAPEEYIRERLAAVREGHASTKLQELTDGRVVAISHRPMQDGGWVATHEDITERQLIEARIAHMAHHDALTDLANRVLLRERMDEALRTARRGEGIAVLCLDLDRFKSINDTLGHPVGDELLKEVANRLRDCAGQYDTVARLGGDEFAILQVAQDQPKAATALATRICNALGSQYHLKDHQVMVDASVGVAVAPHDGTDPDQLLKNADLALYRAKGEGRGIYRFFEPDMDARIKARRNLELDLRAALVNGEFELYYQPLVNLSDDQVTGFEALLRWRHAKRGMVSPTEFIPVAEDIGLIIPLGEWVLRQACAEAANWPDRIKVAVNLSPAQFKSRNLVQTVVSALGAAGLPARRLELEITESVLLHDNEATLARLHQLRDLGVHISMDDFGTGYSSLSYLRSFPFDKIKIDRSFVSDLSHGDDAVAIVRAVTSLANRLGMATTAEGVETEEQLTKIRAEGCTEMQGFLFSPPVPAKQIVRLFLAGTKKRAGSAA